MLVEIPCLANFKGSLAVLVCLLQAKAEGIFQELHHCHMHTSRCHVVRVALPLPCLANLLYVFAMQLSHLPLWAHVPPAQAFIIGSVEFAL
jgi:hypothetical protein